MNALIDLPSRRDEAWKYSDLRSALAAGAGLSPAHDRASVEVSEGLRDCGVIGALASQVGEVDRLSVASGETRALVERPKGDREFRPRLLRVDVASGGALTRIVLQAEAPGVALDAIHVRLGAGAVFRQFIFAEGAKLARVETHVLVDGERAEVELNGVYLCGDARHADLTSVITHRAASSQTQQLVKGAARKGGRGVFQGKIVVERMAQKTDARQNHKGLLLEEGAEIFAKPELMIFADDVACAHGNTAGGIDRDGLFYLRSRGLPEPEARALLTEAFLLEAAPGWVKGDARSEIEQRIATWLRSAA
ncbi:MAG: SufD family Fe-S cluster assembly protein [Hyphomonadaceae bacterium]|nr:SufD family Fe-S cluster assembly protein [Hyphomonadaceae bacterium]